MSVLLIIESFDPEAQPLPSELAAFIQASWNRGDKMHCGVHNTSGHTLALSTADVGATDTQITDVMTFLSDHGHSCSRYIQQLAGPTAALVLATCISPPAVAQEISLPAELVAAAGRLGVSVLVRTYLTNEAAA